MNKADYTVPVLFQDKNVLVINKPPGIIMHAKNSTDTGSSIQSLFSGQLHGGESGREGIVHRLDKDTSGVVILAKNQASLDFLQQQFARREVIKEYIALVWGHLEQEHARVELPIQRSLKSPNRMSIHPRGKEAISEYRVVHRYSSFSQLKIILHTGRTHQIRVQFAHLGHPVVGDLLYSKKPLPQGLERQFLHASKLCLYLPGYSKLSCFESPLAKDLRQFLEQAND